MFKDFCEKRMKTVGRKYVMRDGRNMGLFRDGPQDIMEELADCRNILMVFAQKYFNKYGVDEDFAGKVVDISDQISELARDIEALRNTEKVKNISKDDMRVDRPVPYNWDEPTIGGGVWTYVSQG